MKLSNYSSNCGRIWFGYPWWCTRAEEHTGPCALKRKWWRF